ncbi:MAG: DUF3891 family protein [Chloroflexi bacterium]|nr:DUF3891 family protein [Chloroflexota bacterium]
MILQEHHGELLAARQPDHGLQTGAFATHWGNDETPGFRPRHHVIEAGARHDNGWIGWESHPGLDPETGRGWQFWSLTPHEHVPLYRRGIREAAQYDPYAGLLVSMHGAGLYNNRYGTFQLRERNWTPEEKILVEEFLDEQATFQQSLAERALGRQVHTHVTTDPEVWYNYKLLQVWDRLSLQFVFFKAADGQIAPLPRPDGTDLALTCRQRGELTLALDPYPFDEDSCLFPIATRRLPKKPFTSAEAFLEGLLSAPIEVLECRAVRP